MIAPKPSDPTMSPSRACRHALPGNRAIDFVHDQLATDKKLRVLTVLDTVSRYVPVLDARFSSRGEDVVATLDRACWVAGYPKTIRVDQGSEFISRDMGLWAYQRGVTLDFSRHGKPTDNAFIEAFNGSFRAECVNTRRHCHSDQWRNNDDVLTPADPAEKLEAWPLSTNACIRLPGNARYYNGERPHGASGNKTPITLTKSGGATSLSP